ncbi:MAG TPA: hypothetical protein VGE52_00055, partial [Pirellulales bacterium]
GPTDASSKQTNAELRGPFVELLTEAAGRALTIQAKAASRAAKKPDAFLASLDGFEKEQRRLTEEIVAPIVRAAVAGLKLGEAPGVLTERVAQQLVGESRSRLLEASGTATPERLLAVVEQEVAGWNQRAAIAADLIFTEGA